MKHRMLWADMLKLFAIYLVIWGHAIMHFQPDGEETVTFKVIYAFHMPLFMMLSGYFSVSSMKMLVMDFLTKKFRQLLLPCVTWAVVCWLLITSGLPEGRFTLDLKGLFVGWYGLIDNFWFLKSCFICYTLSWLCYRTGRYRFIAFAIACILCSTVGRFNLSLMFPSFVFGMMLRDNERVGSIFDRGGYVIILLFFILLLYRIMADDAQYILRLLLGLTGAFSFFWLFRQLFLKVLSGRVMVAFSKVGGATLAIYALQAITLEGLLPSIISVSKLSAMECGIFLPLASILLVAIYYVIYRLLSFSKYSSLLLFGENKFYSHKIWRGR